MTESNSPITFIVGPTASGKSACAMEIAREEPGKFAILSMDSMQIYRGADIGTGKPTAAEREEVIHGGLDLVEVGEFFDVAKYAEHAREFLQEQAAARRKVLIVGGTGLYFRALTRGLCEAPSAPSDLRDDLSALSLAELQAQLREADPKICEQLDMQNPRRVQRALEVVLATGESLLVWQQRQTTAPVVSQFETVFIERDREELKQRIAARVREMLATGWIEEVAHLLHLKGKAVLERFAAIGYRDIANELIPTSSDLSQITSKVRGELADKITQLTQQYARRQLTWFRREPTIRVSST